MFYIITDFVSQNKYSIPNTLCQDIIEMFEDEPEKQKDNIKSFSIPHSEDPDSKWFKVENFLLKELHSNLKSYVQNMNKPYQTEFNNGTDGSVFGKNSKLQAGNFIIQKHFKNTGKSTHQNAFELDKDSKSHRVITYLWYLNDVDEGGETEFTKTLKITPEEGKLILFPASWCFPYKNKVPISSSKYVITGWFYLTA